MNAEEVVRNAMASVAVDAGLLLGLDWLNDRFAQLQSRTLFRSLREAGEFVAPGRITAGLVTVSGASVTGDAAAAAAWASQDLVGRFLRVGGDDALYEIIAQAGSVLTLKVPFVGVDPTAAGYRIIARYHKLDPRARWIRWVVIDRYLLVNVAPGRMDMLGPGRRYQSSRPAYWAEVGSASTGEKRVELYPTPQDDILVRYTFWPVPRRFELQDELPVFLDPLVLREGILVDAMRYRMAKALEAAQLEAAATWRNEYRAQETAWERRMHEAMVADRGTDDLEFLLLGGSVVPGRVTNAHDEVVARYGV